ncbi:MAG: RNA 2',3'-cyclic phosphodiesterase [Candidatus Aenigmarchaeota archaeon]|nr:RNA 2',3'-cyclic phosphodiesterase [Candidatus Aenigmarchaeota archaeon]
MVRCFVGVFLPDEIVKKIVEFQKRLVSLPIKAKFVETENLHISLSFLGELDENQIENIKLKLDEISKRFQKFEVILQGIVLIPNEKFVRVIGLEITDKKLEYLRGIIHQSIDGKTNPSHITLCRVNSVFNEKKFIKEIHAMEFGPFIMNVDGIYLIKSVLDKRGPTYSVLYKTCLNGQKS